MQRLLGLGQEPRHGLLDAQPHLPAHGGQFRRGQALGGKGRGHDRHDRVLAIDQGPVHIEDDQTEAVRRAHGSASASGSSAGSGSKPKKCQVVAICSGSGARACDHRRRRDAAGGCCGHGGGAGAAGRRRGEGLAAAIFAVAQDRRAHRHAMGAQLMGAPGDGHQRQPGRAPAGMLDHAVIGDGAPALLVGLHLLAMAAALLGERQVDAALRVAWACRRPSGPVDLARLLLAKGGGEPGAPRRHCGPAPAPRWCPCRGGAPAAAARALRSERVEQGVEMVVGRRAALDGEARPACR